MLKATYNAYWQRILLALLLLMLVVSTVGATAVYATIDNAPYFTLFQAQNPGGSSAPVMVADCNGGGSQNGCGG